MHHFGAETSNPRLTPSHRYKTNTSFFLSSWDQGLQDMCPGEKRTLTIPPHLAYGERAMGPIPAGSTLVFETELVAIDGVKSEL